ncbi:MAG: zinc ABC transporter substrate-binding protein [Rhodobacteraceae bacterium]|nr:zinc ABC transporter substrate-binding protein [Paracoccaceae bacterium]
MRLIFLFLAVLTTGPLRAEPPKIVTTIAPLYGIVSDAMRGVGTPELIITGDEDPHHFSLRPSQISALLEADILFAVGGEMEPWLVNILPQLGDTQVVFLGELPVSVHRHLPLRELHEIGEDHDNDGHAEFDPHMWLDPEVATLWSLEIAHALAAIDPGNAELYDENSIKSVANSTPGVDALGHLSQRLAGVQLITTHDSLQYLEYWYGFNIVGALTSATGDQAGLRSISGLTHTDGPVCLLLDQTHPGVDLTNLFPDAPTASIDPMGINVAGEPNFSQNLYQSIADALEACIPVD